MDSILLDSAEIKLDKQGFLWIVFRESVNEIDLEEAEKHFEACLQFSKGKKISALIDMRNGLPQVSQKAFAFFATSKMTHLRLAEAILIDNLAKRMLARFYYLFHKPKNPLQIFSNEKEAINWLVNFIV